MHTSEQVVRSILLRLGYRQPELHSLYPDLLAAAEECLADDLRLMRQAELEALIRAGVPTRVLVKYEMLSSRWLWLAVVPLIGVLWQRLVTARITSKVERYRRSVEAKRLSEQQEFAAVVAKTRT